MPTIIFVHPDGTEQRVLAQAGESVMQVAVNNQVPGILGDCGGNCSCGTCHGYVTHHQGSHLPIAESYEKDMLSCAMYVIEESRLTCQILVTPELDGLVVRLPSNMSTPVDMKKENCA